jgi:hypothetical protein
MALTKKEQERMENLLKPGEEPGEGYEGSPDMYPDYEEDKQKRKRNQFERKLDEYNQRKLDEYNLRRMEPNKIKGSVTDKELDYMRRMSPNKKMMGGSVNKYKSGAYVTVKTKLGKNKPTKIC